MANTTIRIEQGKGAKDRVVPFPKALQIGLSAYMSTIVNNRYLFESRHHQPYTSRRIQQLTAHYATKAKIEKRVHPHLFRHQCLTMLTLAGLTDAQIQLISGHASKTSLEVYQHIGLASVKEDYQQALLTSP